MRLISIIISEAIIDWDCTLEISGTKCLLPYKKPLRQFIINLFIAKLINTVIRQIVFSLHLLNCGLLTSSFDDSMVAGLQTRYIFTFILPRLHFAELVFVQFENLLKVPCKHKLHYQITAALKCE